MTTPRSSYAGVRGDAMFAFETAVRREINAHMPAELASGFTSLMTTCAEGTARHELTEASGAPRHG